MTSLVVMGVSGCGKSRVGVTVAERLGLRLIEGDEFHSETNRALMHRGIPLTDAHRVDWLDRLGVELKLHPGCAVLTCSALKASYRDRFRVAAPGLRDCRTRRLLDDPPQQAALISEAPGHAQGAAERQV